MIVFVGPPGSGKSTLWRNYFSDYTRVNNVKTSQASSLKFTSRKCMSVAEEALAEGRSVVVDNTNPDREARRPFIELAQKYGSAEIFQVFIVYRLPSPVFLLRCSEGIILPP